MTEPNPIMSLLLQQSSFLGMAEEVDNEIMPIPAQLALKPGDHALMSAANTPLEQDFIVVTVVDPEEHAETFPDWEERVLNSYLLCEFFSQHDLEVTLGWFARVKALPIDEEAFAEADRWRENDEWPDDIPDWVVEATLRYGEQLAEVAPHRVPRHVVCPSCGGTKVGLRIVFRKEMRAAAGTLVITDPDGTERTIYVPMSETNAEDTHSAHLQCTNPACGANADLDDEEWELSGD